MNHARTLFGGALFAAGIAAHHAPAQTFDICYHMVDLSAYGAGTISDDGIGFWGPTTNTGTACSAYSYGGPTDIIVEATCAGTPVGGAGAGAAAYFLVDAPALLELTWDFTGTPSVGGIGFAEVIDGTTGFPLISESVFVVGTPLTGTVGTVLEAGKLYLLIASVATESPTPSMAMFTLSPAPCYADCDGNGVLNVDDVDCYVAAFLGGDPNADCDGNGVLNVDDVDCFIAAFLDGCG